MSHEFLSSLHSHVIETSQGLVTHPAAVKSASDGAKGSGEGGLLADELHRTVGVSMSPQLRARAAARAREVGLSFSRYVQWCLEAELDGSTLEARFRQSGE